MTMKHNVLWGVLLIAGILVGCTSQSVEKQDVGFSISTSGDSTIVTVMSPWQENMVMARYAITEPYQRIACTSATHIGFLQELGLMDRVVGVCRPDRIYNLTDSQRIALTDIGDDMKPNKEAILLAQPNVIVVTTYGEGDIATAQIESLGIPVLYCNEWTENTPLARAEWIRFFGACFGCLDRADSIYNEVAKAYRTCAKQTTNKGVSIMSGQSFRSTWYVPTGNTYMGNLFRDAGADYRYMNEPSTSSLPLTMEQAIQDFAEADVWVGVNASSLEELAAIDNKHTWFRAYQLGHVYNFARRTLPSGANDFWETGVVHPERILKDLQTILANPTTDDSLYFSKRLQ